MQILSNGLADCEIAYPASLGRTRHESMALRNFVATTLAAALVAAVLISATGPRGEDALLRDWSGVLPPWPVYYAMKAAATALDQVRNALLPPHLRAVEYSLAFARTQVLYVMATLQIPDLLATGAKTAEELAPLAGVVSSDALWRVLRLAVAQGILAGSTDKRGSTCFRNSALSATLRSDHPNSVRDFIILQGQEMAPAWGGLLAGLQSGQLPWAAAHPGETAAGRDFWGYLQANPATEELFSAAMANGDVLGKAAMLADFRWGDFDRYIDAGGAHGSFLAALLDRHPRSSGVLFDLPQVVGRGHKFWQKQHASLLSRVEFLGGSFFDADTLPAARGSGDVYLLRTILHDWSDDKAAAILRSVRGAIGATNATLALLEVTPEGGLRETYEGTVYMDVQMLVVCDGKERGRAAWAALFAQSGFRLVGIHPTRGSLKVVEAAPL